MSATGRQVQTFNHQGHEGSLRKSISWVPSCTFVPFVVPALFKSEDRAIDGSSMRIRPCERTELSHGRIKKKMVSGSLTCLALGSLLTQHLDALEREFQPFAAKLGVHDDLLDASEEVRVPHLFPQVREKWMNLRQQKIHFAAHRGLNEQFFVQDSLQHERRRHAPIAAHLAQPVIFRRAHGPGYLQKIIRILGKEFRSPPVTGFAHLRLAAQIVELQNQLGVSDSWLFCHGRTSVWIWKLSNWVIE